MADALARAREIAAKLSNVIASSSGSELGKRKNRWGDGEDGGGGPGLGSVKRKKVYIPVNPDINYLGLLIGPKGATQKQLQESTGAKILIRGRGASKDGAQSNSGHPDDNDELHVAIEGSEDAVERATREVEEILFNPNEAMKLKSEQLRRLAEINNAASGGYDNNYSNDNPDAFQMELHVPNNMVGLIIGKGGENILRIQATLGVSAQIAKESEMKPGETQRSIVLKGKMDKVQEAKQRIDDIIAAQLNRHSSANVPASNGNRELDHPFVVKLPVPNDKVGIIIGRGGSNIKGIQDKTNTTVFIPNAPDEDNPQVRTISIGADSKEAIDACQMEIFLTLQMQQQSAQQAYNSMGNALQVTVPDDRVGIVIGKGGATIKEIQQRLQVKVNIPHGADIGTNPPVRTLNITGPPEQSAMAKYEIEMIAAGTPVKTTSNPAAQAAATAAMYATPGVYNPFGAAAGGAYSAYGLDAATVLAYSAYYGQAAASTAAGYYDPATLQQYAALQAAAAAGVTATTEQQPQATEEVPTDPTAYYDDFWKYCTYYGEAAARVYYGAWAPPEGTPPPEGIVIAPDVGAVAATAQADAATLPAAPAETSTIVDQSQQDQLAALGITTEKSSESEKKQESTQEATAATEEDVAAAAVAWEKYKREYTEWYEAYGKAIGADPNPPSM